MLSSIRGATTVQNNDREEILKATEEMLAEIISANNIAVGDIVSINFTCTADLDKVYPAVSARALGITQAALMCSAELFIENSLPKCIRAGVNVESELRQSEVKHIYLRGAKVLRPDITEGKKEFFSIALDGPSGSGKSTVAKMCAKNMGFSYIDTGAMYRVFAYYCMKKAIDTSDSEAVEKVIDSADIEVRFENNVQKVYCEGEDVTEKIRTQQVAENTSKVSAIPAVRKKLVKMQQQLAKGNNVIMDGRDIGTVVLKDSPLKIYLDASVEIRTKRRVNELTLLGHIADYQTIYKEIEERDFRDMNRETDPLKKADDAVFILSDNLSAAEVCAVIQALARERMK